MIDLKRPAVRPVTGARRVPWRDQRVIHFPLTSYGGVDTDAEAAELSASYVTMCLWLTYSALILTFRIGLRRL